MLSLSRNLLKRKSLKEEPFLDGLHTRQLIDEKFNHFQSEFKAKLEEFGGGWDKPGDYHSKDYPYRKFTKKMRNMLNSIESSKEKLLGFIESQLGIEVQADELIKSNNRIDEIEKFIKGNIQTMIAYFDRKCRRRPSEQKNEEIKYGWLDIECKYDALKEKLKKTLIEKINENDNEQIIDYYNNKNKGLVEKNDQKLQKYITPANKMVLIVGSSQNTLLPHSKKESHVWTQTHQSIYHHNKLRVKEEYAKGLEPQNCSEPRYSETRSLSNLSLRSLAMQPLFHQVNDETSIRPALLKKYFSSVEMTKEEMHILISTSPLLNKCIDKDYIISTLKNMDKSVISQILRNISEGVLEEWQSKRDRKIKDRLEFKRKKSKEIVERIKKWELEQQEKRKFQSIRSSNVSLKKHYSNQLSNLSHSRPRPKSAKTIFSKECYLPLGRNPKHPPSPVFYIQHGEQEESLYKYEKQEISHLKKKSRVTNPFPTRQFYSGGPKEVQEDTLDLSHITTIQSVMRCFYNKLSFKQVSKRPVEVENVEHKRMYKRKRTINDTVISDKPVVAARKEILTLNSEQSSIRKIVSLVKKEHLAQLMALNVDKSFFDKHDKETKTPLYWACELGLHQIASFLLNKGADPNKRCIKGNTPFHVAFQSDALEVIMLVLMNGGELSTVNEEGMTPVAFGKSSTIKNLGLQNCPAIHS